ncbi:hypothetical protein ACWGLF_05135 [Streptomyces puniciscabiei]
MTDTVLRSIAAGRLFSRPAAVASRVGFVLIGMLQAQALAGRLLGDTGVARWGRRGFLRLSLLTAADVTMTVRRPQLPFVRRDGDDRRGRLHRPVRPADRRLHRPRGRLDRHPRLTGRWTPGSWELRTISCYT